MKMKNLIFGVVVALILPFQSSAQTKDELTIAEKVEQLRKTLIDPQKSELDKLAHSDLSYGHSSGVIESKSIFMESLLSGESNFVDITTSEQTIKVSGSTAVVRHKFAANLHNKGKDPSSVNLGVLLIWIKDKGEWKLLARQAFRL